MGRKGGKTQTCRAGLMTELEEKGGIHSKLLCLCQVFKFIARCVHTELHCVFKGSDKLIFPNYPVS